MVTSHNRKCDNIIIVLSVLTQLKFTTVIILKFYSKMTNYKIKDMKYYYAYWNTYVLFRLKNGCVLLPQNDVVPTQELICM